MSRRLGAVNESLGVFMVGRREAGEGVNQPACATKLLLRLTLMSQKCGWESSSSRDTGEASMGLILEIEFGKE